MTKKNKTTPSQIKRANIEQSVRYSDPKKYEDLILTQVRSVCVPGTLRTL